MKNKLVKEDINSILKPKGLKEILNDLIEKGSILDKYSFIISILSENFDELYEEFIDRGIDNEDLINVFIQYYESRKCSETEKINWILSDILKDKADDITDEMIKNAIL